jgi:hypothetical protein
VIILIFWKGNFGVVAGKPIDEGQLLFFMKLDAQYGRTAGLLAQSSLDVFFLRGWGIKMPQWNVLGYANRLHFDRDERVRAG